MTASFSDFSSDNLKNKVETLALFAKAAYAIQDWENPLINDPSPGANEAYAILRDRGWRTVDLDVYEGRDTFTPSSTQFTSITKMDNGFYTYANAAVLVARSDDSLVISFRGTNDSSEKGENRLDPTDQYHPDKDHWIFEDFGSDDSMTEHFAFFTDFVWSLQDYISDNPSVQNVYVTGHSMGGAMAIEYMSRVDSPNFESVVFAAAPFTYKRNLIGAVHRKDYLDDDRILQIEISGDPIAKTWDIGLGNSRPGNVVNFHGDQTMDEPDSEWGISFRSDNHNMNYYLSVASSIDSESWGYISLLASGSQSTDVLIGGEQQGSEYIAGSQADVLRASSQVYVYGGENTDYLAGSDELNILLGGSGNDTLMGAAANDILVGGRDIDTAEYQGGCLSFYG